MGCPPEIPVTGERKNIKILGAIELWRTRFDYRQDTVFNATAYLGFLEQLARRYRRQGAILIQDNASYHKDAEVWAWFKSNRHWLEVHQLPPYSPELNPTERLWQHTRKNGTHNRFFGGLDALLATLTRVFGEMQSHPQLVQSYLNPFVSRYVPFFMRGCIGGYLARTKDPPPGNAVMWRGLSRLTDLELGFVMGAQLVGN